jgi:hypothetical protein
MLNLKIIFKFTFRIHKIRSMDIYDSIVLTANKIFHSNNKKGYTMYQEFLCLTDTTGFIFTNKA